MFQLVNLSRRKMAHYQFNGNGFTFYRKYCNLFTELNVTLQINRIAVYEFSNPNLW
jgi:hypothetical protein